MLTRFGYAASCCGLILATLSSTTTAHFASPTLASLDASIVSEALPAAVLHHAIPYGYIPDPNPPDSSKAKADDVDEAFAERVRARKAQDILKQEIEEKFISLYGQQVSMDAKCTASDPGDVEWKDPMPSPFNTSTTDRVALEDHALRLIVQDAIKAKKKLENTDRLDNNLVRGVGIVHDLPTVGANGYAILNNQTEIDILADDVAPPTNEKKDGVEMGSRIDMNLSHVVKQYQKDARARDIENILGVVDVEA